MAVLAFGIVGPAAEAGVAAEDEELGGGEIVDCALAGDFDGGIFGGGVIV